VQRHQYPAEGPPEPICPAPNWQALRVNAPAMQVFQSFAKVFYSYFENCQCSLALYWKPSWLAQQLMCHWQCLLLTLYDNGYATKYFIPYDVQAKASVDLWSLVQTLRFET
jgi:hypothetical protein